MTETAKSVATTTEANSQTPPSLERHVTDELEAIISQQAKRATRGVRRRATSPHNMVARDGQSTSSLEAQGDNTLWMDSSHHSNSSDRIPRAMRLRSPQRRQRSTSSLSPPRSGYLSPINNKASSPRRSPPSTSPTRFQQHRVMSHGSSRSSSSLSPKLQNTNSSSGSNGDGNRLEPGMEVPGMAPKLANSDDDDEEGEDEDEFDDEAPLPGSPQHRQRISNFSLDNDHDQGLLDGSSDIMDAHGNSDPSFARCATQGARRNYFKMLDQRSLLSFRNINDQVVANNKPRTYMSRLYVTFQDCLAELNTNDNTASRGVESAADYNAKLEAMAILIHECMSSDARNYHSVQHVFEISDDLEDPIAILSAMFHDCIYYSVDGGLSDHQEELLHGCFVEQPDEAAETGATSAAADYPQKTCLAHMHDCQSDSASVLCMVQTVFGYATKEEITFQNGLNEFLSAVVAVRQLEPHLTKAQLAKIAVCICATIPFKNKRQEGQPTHMDRIFENMVTANDKFQLGMEQDELVKAVQLAAQLANNDVGNFGSEDIYYFIDNTWSLLTETNNTLRKTYLFTVHEFQFSLYKMNGFFNFLDPKCIFASFRGVPPQEHVDKLTAQAAKNLEQGKKYVGAKLLSASVLSAFAQLTGGDAPLSLFVGDLPSRHHESTSIDDCLPKNSGPIRIGGGSYNDEEYSDDEEVSEDTGDPSHCDMQVFEILSGGRRSESSFDIKQSPLGAFLYGVVGDRGLAIIMKHRKLHPMDDENAMALLTCLPFEVTEYLARSIAMVALSRADRILELVDKIQEANSEQKR